ncbi:MAG: hypothetical protein ACPG4T_18545, partial [Nannocystaceae bacterium]
SRSRPHRSQATSATVGQLVENPPIVAFAPIVRTFHFEITAPVWLSPVLGATIYAQRRKSASPGFCII